MRDVAITKYNTQNDDEGSLQIAYKVSAIELEQGWAKYGPRAKSGPLRPFAWPTEQSLHMSCKI